MALAAVVVIAIAGIYMVVGMGEESSKDKAKKIITYAIIGLIIIALAAGIVLLIITATGAGGLFGPVPDLGATGGTDIRATIIATLRAVLNFMALAAVVMIVIAGIILVVSGGDEQMKDKAKRIILYTFIGLIIILMASAIVFIFSNAAG
jgi:amino acid transporter